MNAMQRIALVALAVLGLPLAASAQTVSSTTNYTENFTGSTTNNSWYYSNGACLTASSSAGTPSPGQIPGCVTMTGPGGYYYGKTLVGGSTGHFPDNPGALRFTNNNNFQRGAIISNFTFPLASNGIKISFTTESYEGDSGGSGHDGADGISFFLQDASKVDLTDDSTQASAIGANGGSLAYSCSNETSNYPQDGLIGAYLGLGIDEYGNFLNKGDNTATGDYSLTTNSDYQWDRIGLRGAGNVNWNYLTNTYPTDYPSSTPATGTPSAQNYGVLDTCRTNTIWKYSNGGWTNTGTPLPSYTDYAVIPNAFKVLTGSLQIANESATRRGYGSALTPGSQYGVPITYNLTITPAGLLSLSYSYNGGAFQPVITGQNITTSNGPIPAQVRFGFAGSDGGATNIHEIMCFQASPQNQSQSSAGLNQKQTAKVQTGTQVYFAFYNANNWTGSLTSQYLITPPGATSPNALEISPTVNWDASCVLTGVPSGQTCATTGVAGPTAAEGPTSRAILTWNGSQGVPFEWSDLNSAEQTALDLDNTTNGYPLSNPDDVLNYLRGDRSLELNAYGVGEFRARTSVLGDIIDSSPTWVGPPSASFPTVWKDLLNPTATMPENATSAETYPAFETLYQTRTNVVYAGANDGLLHGFRTGSFNSSGQYVATYNDGYEVLAYMPGYVVNAINAYATRENDYPDPLYAHNFSVDAPPGVGDLFYGGQWHTWLVGGLGAGGSAIYALDITNPANFSEANATSTVIGEWSTTTTGTTTTSTLTCANVTNCGNNLGLTYGDPQIRRFHNGDWGAVFGNGLNSSTGDAGIYVMLVDPTTGSQTFYYLSTGSAGTGDGITYVTAADLDGDHIVDYVYAGDAKGNVWRFDLTSNDPTQWTASPVPVFTTAANQPITSRVIVALVTAGGARRVMLEFGTGRQIPFSVTSAATYSNTQQALYGVWDWNMGSWNSKSAAKYASLPTATGIAAPTSTITGTGSLEQQTITATYDASLAGSATSSTPSSAYYYRTVSANTICWADTSGCNQYGWYLNLSAGYANPTDPNGLQSANTNYPYVYEQVIFNPVLEAGAFIVNTTIPPTSSLATCAATSAAGWTMAIDPATGGAFPNSFFGDANHNFLNVNNQAISGIALSGTGSPSFVTQGTMTYMVTQTVSGTGAITAVNPQGGIKGTRLTWIEKR